MLKNELPRIVTKQIPGPKAAKWIARRGEAVPSAIKCVYPIVIAPEEKAPCLRMWMEIISLIG